MNKYAKDWLLIVSVVAAVLGGCLCYHQSKKVNELTCKLDLAQVQMANAVIPIERDTIHDSIPVVTQVVVEVAPKSLTDALAADEKLIKDLRLKVKQLESMMTTSLQVSDTVPAYHAPEDSLFFYADDWAEVKLSLKDSTFYYNIRDSLSTIVYREYKHKFLWWRWGTKGYRIKIINFNPRARVTYNKYIKAEK